MKTIKPKAGMTVTLLTGVTYTIAKVERNRVWLTREGMMFPAECSPELVKLCLSRK